jgi:hypothetical protein
VAGDDLFAVPERHPWIVWEILALEGRKFLWVELNPPEYPVGCGSRNQRARTY